MTHVGDLVWDPVSGWREVVAVQRAEEIVSSEAMGRSLDEVSAIHRDPFSEKRQELQRAAYARRTRPAKE